MGTNADYQGRIEDDRFVTGAGSYVSDFQLPGLVHAVVVRSTVAHATINAVDAEDARAMPGVLAIYTAADLAVDGIGDQPCTVTHPRPDGEEAFKAGRRVLARDKVRHLGEAVALVVAETRQAAIDAAEMVVVDTDDLDLVVDSKMAIEDGAPQVWDEVPGNIAYVWSKGDGAAVDAILDGASHIARLESHVTRVIVNSMEPRGVMAHVDGDGRLVVHPSTQNPYPMRAGLSAMLNIPADNIQVVAGDVGGSFGMKSGVYPEDILVCWAARKLNRPVKWISDRVEGFVADEQGRDVHMQVSLGLDVAGRFLALKVVCHPNIGAYLSGRSLNLIGNFGGIAGVYNIGKIYGEIRGVHTNTQVTAPYRGAGRPEATFAIERTIDIAARELGIDPLDIRRRNAVPPEAMPYDTGFTFNYDCGEFEQNMIAAADMADYAGFETRRAAAAAKGRLRGVGIANPIEVAGGPYVKPGRDCSRLHVAADGKVTLFSGIMSVGQGIETTFSNMVAERLGVPVENVVYSQGDTDNLVHGRGNGGSSGAPVGASCVSITIDNLIEAAKPLAAEMLQSNADQLEFGDGEFRVAGATSSVSLTEVAGFAADKDPAGLAAEGEFIPPDVTYPNGCHICEVEVDPETGEIEFIKYSVCEDIGTVINPTLANGQMHGGIAMGAGQALFERSVYDPDSGQLVTGSFMDYTMPRADDLPSFDFQTRPVPTAVNPVGAKGIGEAGTVGSMVATINAVCDALKPLGVKHIEMPATPDRIWAAIQAAKAGNEAR